MAEHLINRLQFEINYPDEEQAFNFRHNFAITFQEQIAEVVDHVCSKYVGEEEWLRIGKLEIDLGRFSPNSFDINFKEVFKNKFEKELTQKLSQISPEQKKASRQLSKAELFQYFLQKGILPWWADEGQIDLDEVSLDLLINQTEVMRHFFYENRFVPYVWQRVVFQLNKKAKSLIISLLKELVNTRELFNDWVMKLQVIVGDKINIEWKISEEVLDNVILRSAPRVFQNLIDKQMLLQILEESSAELFFENDVTIKQIIYENKAALLLPEEKEFKNPPEEKQPLVMKADSNRIDTFLGDETIYSEAGGAEEFTDKYLVKHAGIILLAPFLKSFFTNLDLLQEVEWKNKDAQHRAVHLLKFLSTGEQKTPEYNLTLEKIICGIAIEEPIPVEVLLHEKEINEAEMLLESVIEHWKVLKNTSIDGLRETFFKRDGLIKKQEDGWHLQVERKTLDVLVDSIPWGYSTITFPWNNYLIFVEW